MKALKFISFVLLAGIVFSSCKKDEESKTSPIYDGIYSISVYEDGDYDGSMSITVLNGVATGTSRIDGEDVAITGTVNQLGIFSGSGTVTSSMAGIPITITLTLSGTISANGTISGTWVDSFQNSGTFEGEKVTTSNPGGSDEYGMAKVAKFKAGKALDGAVN